METLFFAVVNRDKANTVMNKAEECGASSGNILLAEGTVQSRILEKLGITESHKALLMIPASLDLSNELHDFLGEIFKLSKRNKGITFSIPFQRCLLNADYDIPYGLSNDFDYTNSCIITIVDKGRGKDCIKAARSAGARGGTLIHAHGAGIPTEFLYPLIIEPQKDLILIVSPKDKAASIRNRISSDLELDRTGNGFIFSLPVIRTGGLFEDRSDERKGLLYEFTN